MHKENERDRETWHSLGLPFATHRSIFTLSHFSFFYLHRLRRLPILGVAGSFLPPRPPEPVAAAPPPPGWGPSAGASGCQRWINIFWFFFTSSQCSWPEPLANMNPPRTTLPKGRSENRERKKCFFSFFLFLEILVSAWKDVDVLLLSRRMQISRKNHFPDLRLWPTVWTLYEAVWTCRLYTLDFSAMHTPNETDRHCYLRRTRRRQSRGFLELFSSIHPFASIHRATDVCMLCTWLTLSPFRS